MAEDPLVLTEHDGARAEVVADGEVVARSRELGDPGARFASLMAPAGR